MQKFLAIACFFFSFTQMLSAMDPDYEQGGVPYVEESYSSAASLTLKRSRAEEKPFLASLGLTETSPETQTLITLFGSIKKLLLNPGACDMVRQFCEEHGVQEFLRDGRIIAPVNLQEMHQSCVEFCLKSAKLVGIPNHWVNALTIEYLTHLDLSENLLSDFPVQLKGLNNLEVLDLKKNKIKKIPDDVFDQMGKLSFLNLSFNKLKIFPPVEKIATLRVLDCGENPIRCIPSWIGKLQNLRDLYVYNAEISFLPPAICTLQNLNILYVYRNFLTDLPPMIGLLTRLTELDVGHNRLKSLPKSLFHLRHLSNLDVQSNCLSPRFILNLRKKFINRGVLLETKKNYDFYAARNKKLFFSQKRSAFFR